MVVMEDDPRRADVTRLLQTHLALMRSLSPPGSVHALDLDGLTAPDMTFWTARAGPEEGDTLLGCGALRELDALPGGGGHGEIKSMHTAEAGRRRGTATRLLLEIERTARARGYRRLSLETGRPASFAAAQALYRRHGYRECPPFAGYTDDPFSLCMTKEI